MDQAHLGYTDWADPPENSLRAIPIVETEVPDTAAMGVAVEGSEAAWPVTQDTLTLPEFDPFNDQRRSVEIFNRGRASFPYKVTCDKPWIRISAQEGTIGQQTQIWVSIDWKKTRPGRSTGHLVVDGAGQQAAVLVQVFRPSAISPGALTGFIEGDGHISIEAEHFTKNRDAGSNRWIKVPDYGHTLSAMRSTASPGTGGLIPGTNSPCLEYRIYLVHDRDVMVTGTFGPTLNFVPGRGLRYAVSIDNETPQVVTLVREDFIAQHGNMEWENTVADNARRGQTRHLNIKTGYHTLKFWMVDPGVVLQKIVVDCGGVRPSYLGPPESYHEPRMKE
jgi:hypothetical protein